MTRPIMCSVIRTLLSFCACGTVMFLSATAYAQQAQLIISCQSTKLVPFEPLLVHVELLNATPSEEIRVPGRWKKLVQIEIRCVGNTDYVPMHRWWRPQVAEPPLPDIALKPGSSVAVDMGFYPFDRDDKLLLEQGQSYEIRASLSIPSLSTNIVSNLQVVQIAEPAPEDAGAIAELKANKQLRFWVLPEQIAYDPVQEERAAVFARKHGETRLGKYIKTAIGLRNSHLAPDERVSRFRKEVNANSR